MSSPARHRRRQAPARQSSSWQPARGAAGDRAEVVSAVLRDREEPGPGAGLTANRRRAVAPVTSWGGRRASGSTGGRTTATPAWLARTAASARRSPSTQRGQSRQLVHRSVPLTPRANRPGRTPTQNRGRRRRLPAHGCLTAQGAIPQLDAEDPAWTRRWGARQSVPDAFAGGPVPCCARRSAAQSRPDLVSSVLARSPRPRSGARQERRRRRARR